MRRHIQFNGVNNSSPGSQKAEISLVNDQGIPVEDYAILFRELFCIAAGDLAEDINQPLENMGVLFDEIINTGQVKPKAQSMSSRHTSVTSDPEHGPAYSRGQVLFLVNKVNRRESEHLQAAGFRFASTHNVAPILAQSMGVDREDITHHIDVMREFARETHILEPGIHLAYFALRAAVSGGFDILARRDARNQLPAMQLPFSSLEGWQIDYLQAMDTFNVIGCMRYLSRTAESSTASMKEHLFATQLLSTLRALKDEIAGDFFNEATLVAKPIFAPCRGHSDDAPPTSATLITFKQFVPIHTRAPGMKLEFVPLGFFNAQQFVYKNSPDHSAFARKVYREFAPVLDIVGGGGRPGSLDRKNSTVSFPAAFFKSSRDQSSSSVRTRTPDLLDEDGRPIPRLLKKPSPAVIKKSRAWLPSRRRHSTHGRDRSDRNRGDGSSEKNLFDVNGSSSDQGVYNGIMVSQEVSVDVKIETVDSKSGIEMDDIPVDTSRINGTGGKTLMSNVEVTREDRERTTFVDELFGICAGSRNS